MEIKKLSTNEHWDKKYQKLLKNKIYLNTRRFTSISEFLFWKIIEKYLPKGNLKILEIGSAPGSKLVEFHKKMKYEPYGIDYTYHGCELNKEFFLYNDCNPENVIHDDFFSDSFQNNYKNTFDVVCSFGFIEHFDNVKDVIDKHYNLLKKDGFLIISIPNFKGINFHLTNYFAGNELIEMHNLDIMNLDAFDELFNKNKLEKIFLGYYGIFDFFVIYYVKSGNNIKNMIYNTLFWINVGLSVIFKLFGRVNLESKLENKNFSPFLICICKKK